MKTDVYNTEGKKAGTIELPEELFGVGWNPDLVHQVVTSMESNARAPIASTKGRDTVRGGGKKPWRQKGTGRARHGSRRSPIWVGGGVTHGPTSDKVYRKKINKKMRAKAFLSVLSQKFRENEILFVEPLSFNEPKTRQARSTLDAWATVEGFERLATKKRNAAILSLCDGEKEAVKTSFRNLGSVKIQDARSLNPSLLLSASYVIIEDPDTTFSLLKTRLS